jgi:hypothetical protein
MALTIELSSKSTNNSTFEEGPYIDILALFHLLPGIVSTSNPNHISHYTVIYRCFDGVKFHNINLATSHTGKISLSFEK